MNNFIVDEKLIINYIKQACPQCLHTDKEDGWQMTNSMALCFCYLSFHASAFEIDSVNTTRKQESVIHF